VNIYLAGRIWGSYYPYPTRPIDIPRPSTTRAGLKGTVGAGNHRSRKHVAMTVTTVT